MPIDYKNAMFLLGHGKSIRRGSCTWNDCNVTTSSGSIRDFKPLWPIPKVFRIANNKKIIKGIFEGSTINTPSMICVEDALDGLNWAEKNGGLNFLLDTSINHLI